MPTLTHSSPCTIPPAPTLNDDITHNGSISLSFFGGKHALGFRGDSPFIERCFNMCVNRGISARNARLRWPNGLSSRFAYIVVKSKERVLKGIAEQFRSEIIMRRQIAPLCECWDENEGYTVQWDEQAVEDLALHLATTFMSEHVHLDNFMTRTHRNLGPVYGMAEHTVGRMWSNAGSGDTSNAFE